VRDPRQRRPYQGKGPDALARVLRGTLGKRIHLTPWRSHSIATELTGGISALPFGPMGILCLQRTLDQGRRAGMIAAAGIVVALGLWGVMVAQGMHQVSV
jgi:hypothetical protein